MLNITWTDQATEFFVNKKLHWWKYL